jgi:hypothetical protein
MPGLVSCRYCTDGYRDLPFPFEDIGLGKEGEPASLDMEQEMSFEGLIGMLRSWSAVTTAKQQGVDLLGEHVVKELEEGWGGASLVRKVTYKGFLLAGTPGPVADELCTDVGMLLLASCHWTRSNNHLYFVNNMALILLPSSMIHYSYFCIIIITTI